MEALSLEEERKRGGILQKNNVFSQFVRAKLLATRLNAATKAAIAFHCRAGGQQHSCTAGHHTVSRSCCVPS